MLVKIWGGSPRSFPVSTAGAAGCAGCACCCCCWGCAIMIGAKYWYCLGAGVTGLANGGGAGTSAPCSTASPTRWR